MKKYNWAIGFPYSVIISCVGSLPVLFHFSRNDIPGFMHSVLYYLIFSLVCWWLFQFLIQSLFLKMKKSKASWYFFLCFVFIITAGFAFEYLNGVLTNTSVWVIESLSGSDRRLMIIFKGALIGGLSSFIIYYLEVIKDNQKNALEIQQLKQAQLQASLSSFREQLSPHFLFNSLNTLKSIIRSDAERSVDFVLKLSEVYRYLLKHSDHQTVRLEEELDFVNAYLFLLKERFGGNLKVSIQVPAEYLKTFIPPVSLQLLVENAVKHNIVSADKPLDISITINKDRILVKNIYQPKSVVDGSGGFGLSGMNSRYRALTKSDIEIKLDDQYFVVMLPLIKDNAGINY